MSRLQKNKRDGGTILLKFLMGSGTKQLFRCNSSSLVQWWEDNYAYFLALLYSDNEDGQ